MKVVAASINRQVKRPDAIRLYVPWILLAVLDGEQIIRIIGPDPRLVWVRMAAFRAVRRIVAPLIGTIATRIG